VAQYAVRRATRALLVEIPVIEEIHDATAKPLGLGKPLVFEDPTQRRVVAAGEEPRLEKALDESIRFRYENVKTPTLEAGRQLDFCRQGPGVEGIQRLPVFLDRRQRLVNPGAVGVPAG
jgi:hypothetical protein